MQVVRDPSAWQADELVESERHGSRQQDSKQKPRGLSLRAYFAILKLANRPHSKVRLTHPRSNLTEL